MPFDYTDSVREYCQKAIDIPRLAAVRANCNGSLYGFPDAGWDSESLRAVADALPCELWIDTDCGAVMDCEPQGYDDDGEWIEPDWSSIRVLSARGIRRAVLGECGEYV